jgi:hypothetical protein
MSQRLAAAATREKVTTVFVDADHVDIFDHAKAEMDAAIRQLIDQVRQGS